jgi:hypothetical protein
VAAYQEFRRTGKVPAGLDVDRPRPSSRSKPGLPPPAPRKLPPAPRRTADDLERAQLAAQLKNITEPKVYEAFARRKIRASEMLPIAREQARNDLSDRKLIAHYKDSGIFVRRGLSPDDVKKLRDDWYTGRPIPLWAVPPNTPIAVYRSADAEVPDLVGRMVGVVSRQPRDEAGNPGLRYKVPFIQFVDDRNRFYEYPALLSGSIRAPHATHASFAAVGPISRGQRAIPQLGWGFPNFADIADHENVGPTAAPEDLDLLVTSLLRSTHWGEAKEKRKADKREGPQHQLMDTVEDTLASDPLAAMAYLARLEVFRRTGAPDVRSRAAELIALLRKRETSGAAA